MFLGNVFDVREGIDVVESLQWRGAIFQVLFKLEGHVHKRTITLDVVVNRHQSLPLKQLCQRTGAGPVETDLEVAMLHHESPVRKIRNRGHAWTFYHK